MDTAPKVLHGDHIWAIADPKKGEQLPIMKQNPPANTFGSEGPSPHNYFADELITEGKATDAVLVKCSSGTPGDDWRIGIKGAIDVIEGCKAKVRYAIENWSLNLSGGVTYCCAGDATDEEKVRAFPDNYKSLISDFRAALENPSLPFVSAITPQTESCNFSPARLELLKLLRRTQADTKVAGATWVDVHSIGLPRSCFHLTGQEQAQLGRMMAQSMP